MKVQRYILSAKIIICRKFISCLSICINLIADTCYFDMKLSILFTAISTFQYLLLKNTLKTCHASHKIGPFSKFTVKNRERFNSWFMESSKLVVPMSMSMNSSICFQCLWEKCSLKNVTRVTPVFWYVSQISNNWFNTKWNATDKNFGKIK